jgi:hypothetical protein
VWVAAGQSIGVGWDVRVQGNFQFYVGFCLFGSCIVVGIGGWTRAGSVLELIYVGGGIVVCIAALLCPCVFLCWPGLVGT